MIVHSRGTNAHEVYTEHATPMNGRPSGRFDRRRPNAEHRVNHRIRVPEVRVIYEGEQLGVMPTHEALGAAQDKGLDLVEISPNSSPPVCRIMDYGKFKFEEAKKKRQQRKSAATFETKEIKFRPKTDDHDMDFKVKHIRRFLEEGNKVRLLVVFRGREMAHPQMGKVVLDRVVERCKDIATVETTPSLEGKRMFMLIAPRPNVMQKAVATKKAQAQAQIAAQAARKDAKSMPEPQEEELDEDEINADVDEDSNEEEEELHSA
jgi:translation initiation factor IF-3